MTTTKKQETLTRPDNVTAYTIGDVIGTATAADNVFTFSGIGGGNGRTCLITSATLLIDSAVATELKADLFLFDTLPVAAIDNAADTITAAELKNCVGSISFATVMNTKLNSVYNTTPDLQVKTGAAGTLYGILIAQNAYVPVAEEVYDIILESKTVN